MHTQLRNPTINRPDPRLRAQHGSHRAPTPAIVSNLEDLEFRVLRAGTDIAVDAPLEDGGGHGVGRHVGV